ncbi:hypothetical protein Q6A77_09360, partial [Aliarcobacter skirrowii]|uniref:polysialyltransferase family glycosyltransferase n=1 Tax=Aliarcobacter skirrowii TaxID=28200 RepID=UPI0029BA65C5
MKKNIVFIDTWTVGANFVFNVATKFKNENLIYIHFNSEYNNRGQKENVDLNIFDKVIDISSYNNSIYETLLDVKPDVVIFISIHGHFHRWANIISTSMGYKNVFFMHGIRSNQPKKKFKMPFTAKLKKINRIIFYVKQYYLFLLDLKKSNKVINSKILLLDFLEMLFKNKCYTNTPKYNIGFNYDLAFVNTESDINYFKKNYFLNEEEIRFLISGNVVSRQNAIKSQTILNLSDTIVFFSQPLISAGYMSREEYLKILFNINKIMIENNYNFVVRLHPRDDISTNELIQNNIKISDKEFYEDAARTSVAISFNSASLLTFNDLKKPIITLLDDRLVTINGL